MNSILNFSISVSKRLLDVAKERCNNADNIVDTTKSREMISQTSNVTIGNTPKVDYCAD